jgi:hypothetical protein
LYYGYAMIEPGQPAPDVEFPDQDGNVVRLPDLRRQRVVLYFYPKADTPGCTTQACGIRDRRAEYDATGATVLGVSSSSMKTGSCATSSRRVSPKTHDDVVLEALDTVAGATAQRRPEQAARGSMTCVRARIGRTNLTSRRHRAPRPRPRLHRVLLVDPRTAATT